MKIILEYRVSYYNLLENLKLHDLLYWFYMNIKNKNLNFSPQVQISVSNQKSLWKRPKELKLFDSLAKN